MFLEAQINCIVKFNVIWNLTLRYSQYRILKKMCSISVVFLAKVIAQDNATFPNSQLNSDISTRFEMLYLII